MADQALVEIVTEVSVEADLVEAADQVLVEIVVAIQVLAAVNQDLVEIVTVDHQIDVLEAAIDQAETDLETDKNTNK
jgi:hypothetical protein